MNGAGIQSPSFWRVEGLAIHFLTELAWTASLAQNQALEK